MGQYYRPAIIDEDNNIQTLSSYDFSNGAKLMEHSWIGNEFVNAVLSIIHNNKRRIAWVGDYANNPFEGSNDYYTTTMSKEAFTEYFRVVWGESTSPRKSFSESDLNILNKNTTEMYLINHTSRRFIDMSEYIKANKVNMNDREWVINPLPLLTACGNDRGGGDFYSNNIGYEDVGTWAFSLIEYSSSPPVGYLKSSYKFIEEI